MLSSLIIFENTTHPTGLRTHGTSKYLKASSNNHAIIRTFCKFSGTRKLDLWVILLLPGFSLVQRYFTFKNFPMPTELLVRPAELNKMISGSYIFPTANRRSFSFFSNRLPSDVLTLLRPPILYVMKMPHLIKWFLPDFCLLM